MTPPYRLCALDLDETTLRPDHTLSERNLRAIRAVIARGVSVVLASGRMHVGMRKFADALGLTGPMISYNGAMVREIASDVMWLHEQVDTGITGEVMDLAAARGLQLNFYHDDLLFSQAMTPWLELYQQRTNAPLALRPDLYEAFRDVPPTKLLIVDAPAKVESLCSELKERYAGRLYVTISSAEYVEMMPPEASKGKALAAVAARLGIAQAEVVAFGDSLNDIPMLEWAGLGVAPSSARPAVLEIVDRVIGHYAEDAVGIALEEMFGL